MQHDPKEGTQQEPTADTNVTGNTGNEQGSRDPQGEGQEGSGHDDEG